MNELYVTNYTPYLGVIISILTIFPFIVNKLIIKENKKTKKPNMLQRVLNIFKYLLLCIIVIIFCIKKDILNIANANIFMAITMFFYILYYELYIKFLINGRKEENLYAPFMYVKIPMQICMSMGIVFASIWTKNILLIILSVIFAIIHIYTSFIYFKNNFSEHK